LQLINQNEAAAMRAKLHAKVKKNTHNYFKNHNFMFSQLRIKQLETNRGLQPNHNAHLNKLYKRGFHHENILFNIL
jgi:hypothetical protein